MKISNRRRNSFLAKGLVLSITAFIIMIMSFFGGRAEAATARKGSADQAKRCINCHDRKTPGIVRDWEKSLHARAGISCIDCHKADPTDSDAIKGHENDPTIIATIVSPKDCARCHPGEAREFEASRHSKARTFIQDIAGEKGRDAFLAYKIEGKKAAVMGCEQCHGTKVVVNKDGRLDYQSWPNNGIGRTNPDGSNGSCAACHTRHRFSIAEARKPETCGTCHMGPDHPQLEAYLESKHGVIYSNEKHEWNFEIASAQWDTKHFRSPTCATCHMSGLTTNTPTHNISERLSWTLEAPRSEKTENWEAKRDKMKNVCLSCHSKIYADNFYKQFDDVNERYNELFDEVNALYKGLVKDRLITDQGFDEPIDYEYFEFWHHEGRRARMGASKMAPDYVQWHGFYELVRNKVKIEETAKEIRKKGSKK